MYTRCWKAEFTFCLPGDSAHFSSTWRTLSPCLGLSVYLQRYNDSHLFYNSQDNSNSTKPELLVVLFKAVLPAIWHVILQYNEDKSTVNEVLSTTEKPLSIIHAN